MGSNWVGYEQLVNQLIFNDYDRELRYSLLAYGKLIYQSDQQNRFSSPMLWIGIYIALASLFCILPMVADLLHGLRNRKLWFPCKYFTLNAASLTVIAVAMKLPMDLNNPKPAMDSKELLTSIIALGVLVITLVVNVCIQIKTGVVSYTEPERLIVFNDAGTYVNPEIYYETTIAIIYVAMLLMLLIIHTCSSLAILKSKQILESKYQTGHETTLKDQELQQPRRLTVEKLKQHVRNYWIMAGTGSPQFMTACSATASASGVICTFSTIIHILIMLSAYGSLRHYKSDYKWSTPVILITQFTGTVLGSIAPLCRCFASVSFKLSIEWIWNHIKVHKVESYWTHKLSDWKQSSIPFPFCSRKCKIVIQKLKILILNFCIGFQMSVVVACKMIGLVPIVFVICIFYCWLCLKSMLSALCIVLGKSPEQLQQNTDLSRYVLQLQDDMEFAERTLEGMSKSVYRLIQKAEKQQPKNLMKLLEESRSLEGVAKFNNHHVSPLLAEIFFGYWSLPLVTLTTIASSLPNIQKNIVDNLISGVSEGLVYVTLVEESFNATDDNVNIQKAAKTLWLEVEVYHRWLGNKLQELVPEVKTARQILQWYRDTSNNMVSEVEAMNTRGRINDDSFCRLISANSMYQITETFMFSYDANTEEVSQEELFEQLSLMICDILAACLSNLPQVIAIKCHTSAIEKREASVHAAAQLLGETMQIINCLEDRELPSMNTNELVFVDK